MNLILKLSLLIYSIIIFLSCAKQDNKSNEISNKQDKISVTKSDTSINKTPIVSHLNILDKTLIGVSENIKDTTDPFKKYWLDFYSTCMGSAPNFYIDSIDQKIYFFAYEEGVSFDNKNQDFLAEFDIVKHEKSKSSLNLTVKKGDVTHTIDIIKTINKDFYELQLDTILSNTDIGRYKIFTIKTNEHKFEKEGCDDFDG